MAQAVRQQTGWVGWIYFAAMVMVISGILNVITGIVAATNSDWVVFTNREALLLDITGWGWVHLIIGVIMVVSGFGVTKGHFIARTVGVIMASISLIANFAFLPAYPFWSLVIIVIDMLVIWALTVHGSELRD